MDIHFKIPVRFLIIRRQPSWQDLAFGLEEQLVEPNAATVWANDLLANGAEATTDLLELADARPGEPVRAIVERLAQAEVQQPEKVRAHWLYWVLSWLYENRSQVEDYFSMIESIYVDFNYPPEISMLVGYMPSDEPCLGNREANDKRRLTRWKRYLEAHEGDEESDELIDPH